MIQTVIFDLDGTLLNTLDDLADAGNWVCRQNGWTPHPVEAYKQMVGNGIPNLVERFSPPEARTAERLEESLRQFTLYYNAHKEDKTAPYDGMTELVDTLHAEGIQTAVFSNKADGLCRSILLHYFGDRFDAVRGSLPDVPTKPDPTGLYALMEQLRTTPNRTLFVGDSNVDIRTGHNGGLLSVGVLWGFRSKEELSAAGADVLAATPSDILRYIRQQNA